MILPESGSSKDFDSREFLCYGDSSYFLINLVYMSMDRSKIVAVATGIISIGLAIAYLLIVQIIDSRGEMLPAPITETLFQGLLRI